jgi:hypothetical protein
MLCCAEGENRTRPEPDNKVFVSGMEMRQKLRAMVVPKSIAQS